MSFTCWERLWDSMPIMRRLIQSFCLGMLPLILAGCSTQITNLSPSQQIRNPAGLYHLEAKWESAQQTVRTESIKSYVVVGTEMYPMQPTPMVKNRWETMIPVPADQNMLNYRYKFDFEYYSIPNRRQNSKLSEPFQLKVLEK